jgi:hypothetical protein
MSDENLPLEEGQAQIEKNATIPEAQKNKEEAPDTLEAPKTNTSSDLASTDEVIEEEEVESSDSIEESEISKEKESVDYSNLTKLELITAFENLVGNSAIQSIKEDAEEIKTEFNNQFQEELTEKKVAFLAAGGNMNRQRRKHSMMCLMTSELNVILISKN